MFWIKGGITISKKEAEAYALAKGTIVNAIANFKGGAFAIDLKLYARVKLIEDSDEINVIIQDNPNEDVTLVKTCVKNVLKRYSEKNYGALVYTRSEIPIAKGLASSSAAANAVILATLAALNKTICYEEILNLNVETSIQTSVSITGAYDDAAASLLGGGVLTDNMRRKILKRFLMDDNLFVIITIPEEKVYTKSVDKVKLSFFKEYVDLAFDIAFKDIYKAIVLNSLIYCSLLNYTTEPIYLALKHGAKSSGLCGKGPAFFALCYEENLNDVKEAFEAFGNVIVTRVNNQGSRILRS